MKKALLVMLAMTPQIALAQLELHVDAFIQAVAAERGGHLPCMRVHGLPRPVRQPDGVV